MAKMIKQVVALTLALTLALCIVPTASAKADACMLKVLGVVEEGDLYKYVHVYNTTEGIGVDIAAKLYRTCEAIQDCKSDFVRVKVQALDADAQPFTPNLTIYSFAPTRANAFTGSDVRDRRFALDDQSCFYINIYGIKEAADPEKFDEDDYDTGHLMSISFKLGSNTGTMYSFDINYVKYKYVEPIMVGESAADHTASSDENKSPVARPSVPSYSSIKDAPTYVVPGRFLCVRAGTGETYDIIATLEHASTVNVIANDANGWSLIQLGTGPKASTGFVRTEYLLKIN